MTDTLPDLRTRYDERFAALRQAGRKAFIPFTLLGWPDPETSFRIVKTMIEAGADALELGIPFSDPMADGPVIQQAATEALENGFRVDDAFALLRRIRALDDTIPIGLMVYYNVVLSRGVPGFLDATARAGADGILIADLPAELGDEVAPEAARHGLAFLMMASPLTTPERLAKMARHARGFLYVVSRLGITGSEARYDETLSELLVRLRQATALPLCVGFGISAPEHARRMFALGADGVITGSRVIEVARENPDGLRPYLEAMAAETVPAFAGGA